jgi:serine/threonine protein kinase
LAFNHIHSKGIIHKDLDPTNIFVNSFGKTKIIDFGVAKLDTKLKDYQEDFLGDYYRAPETLSGIWSDKSDIWSLGVILYQLMCGNLPFGGSDKKEVLENIKEKDFNFDKPEWTGISESCKDLIRMMLKPQVENRWNAADCLKAKWF